MAYFVTDAEGVVRQANRAACRMLGVNGRFLPGKPLSLFVRADARPAFHRRLSALLRGEPEWHGDAWLQPRPEDGPAVLAELTVVPFRDPETRGTGLRWQARDVTAERPAAEAARREAADLEALVRARTAELESALRERESSERRLKFLSEAGALLASSHDFGRTLAHVADRAVPLLGDWCFVETVGPDGRAERHAGTALGEGQLAKLRAWEATGADRAGLFAALGWRTGLWLPLAAHGRTVGGLALGSAGPREWAGEELATAEAFARQVAAAVGTAELVRRLGEADRRGEEFLSVLAHELRGPLTPLRYAAHALASKVPPESESRGRPASSAGRPRRWTDC